MTKGTTMVTQTAVDLRQYNPIPYLSYECPNCQFLLENKAGQTWACLKCGNMLNELGYGTHRIEQEIKKIIPDASISRMDRDEMKGKHKLLNLYGKLERREIDVLIGTQMVTKGHDLPGVTLVGIISADLSLYTPDFRSGERTFQLITQVAGRAGRGDEKGKVLVQTYNNEHPAIVYASKQDSIDFLKNELLVRQELGFPPFTKLIISFFLVAGWIKSGFSS